MTMTLNDIYESLATGELSQVVMGSGALDSEASVPVNRRKQLRNAVQLGLTDIHKRVLIKEGTVAVDLANGPGKYTISSKYAMSNARSKETNKYLMDLSEPFTDDLLKISRILDHAGNELAVNVIGSDTAIQTPQTNIIEVPSGYTGTFVTVKYHADHPQFSAELADSAPEIVTVNLPNLYLLPLTLFVASRIINPIGLSEQSGFHEGNNYFSRYLAAIQDVINQGMHISQTSDSTRFADNGWA